MARALLKKRVGDDVMVPQAGAERGYRLRAIEYPATD
jgi:transcription elongation GreA/GreB family factor